MSLSIRDFDTMVEAILDRIIAADVGITDRGRGSVIRTLIEAIIAEIDIQYYTLDGIYNAISDFDTASGEDLDNMISILGVVRNPATKAIGIVRFQRSTPYGSDIPIPIGTVVTTRPDANNNIVEFITTSSGILLAGETYVDINIEAVESGSIYISPGQVTVMSVPVINIESVTNTIAIDSGTDEENDDQLRNRTQLVIGGMGKATSDALRGAILDIDTIESVTVVDNARGIGTVDIVVVGSTMPLPQLTLDEINIVINNTKAAGIDVNIISPTIVPINITISTTVNRDIAGNAILSYISLLSTGGKFIINQMEKMILSEGVITDDITTSSPSSNVTCTESEIIRAGIITINGVVWNG